MKKLFTLAAAAFISFAAVSTASALDLGDIKGTWRDSKWDANWTFSADGKIRLSTAKDNAEVFVFTDDNVQNFKLNADKNGVSIAFDCKETNRSYKFTKPLTLNADLKMHINPDWTDVDYDTTIKFKL